MKLLISLYVFFGLLLFGLLLYANWRTPAKPSASIYCPRVLAREYPDHVIEREGLDFFGATPDGYLCYGRIVDGQPEADDCRPAIPEPEIQ